MSHTKNRMLAGFGKKVFSPRLFFRDLVFVFANILKYMEVIQARTVSLAFAEKVRLATSAVNQCVLCARVHLQLAQHAGVELNQIRALLSNDLRGSNFDETELPALLYAQHYAESNGTPDPAMTSRLYESYGQEKADHIVLIVRLVNFFNLIGNTLEALASRIRGHKAHRSSLLFEILVALISLPIALPLFAYTRWKGNRFDFSNNHGKMSSEKTVIG
jgi:AhpD family alkylhydroperoxidase